MAHYFLPPNIMIFLLRTLTLGGLGNLLCRWMSAQIGISMRNTPVTGMLCHTQTLRHAHAIQTHPTITDVQPLINGDCRVVLAHVFSPARYPASTLSMSLPVDSATCFAEGCLHTLSEFIASPIDCPTRNAHWQRTSTMHSAMPALFMRIRHLLISICFPSKVAGLLSLMIFLQVFMQHLNGVYSSTTNSRLPRPESGKLHAPINQKYLEPSSGSSAHRNYCNEVAGNL